MMMNILKRTIVLLTAASSLLFQSCSFFPSGTAQPITTAETISESVGTPLDTEQPLDLAIVIGARKDMNPISTSKILPVMYQLAETGGNLSVIVADGAPKQNKTDCTVPPMSGSHDASYYKKIRQTALNLCSRIESMQANTPNADINAAINAAVDTLKASPNRQDVLIVLDNGLSTKGICLETLDGIDTDSFYSSMKDEMPDISQIHAVWYGIGETSDLYPDGISRVEKASLRNFWSRMLGDSVIFKEDQISFVNESADRSSLPDVKLVRIAEHDHTVPTTVAASEYKAPTTVTRANEAPVDVLANGPIRFSNGIIEFEPDSCELNQSKMPQILQYLSPIAESVNYYHQEILLIGSIAHVSDSPDQGVEFSRLRAEAVAAVLTELNVPADQIHIAGAGYADTRITDERDYTEGNEEIAQANRKVLMFDVNGNYDDKVTKAIIRDYLN